MSVPKIRIGQKVAIAGKNVRGEVVYIGETDFASGKWAGVILTEPKGRNNGTVEGKTYFSVSSIISIVSGVENEDLFSLRLFSVRIITECLFERHNLSFWTMQAIQSKR